MAVFHNATSYVNLSLVSLVSLATTSRQGSILNQTLQNKTKKKSYKLECEDSRDSVFILDSVIL